MVSYSTTTEPVTDVWRDVWNDVWRDTSSGITISDSCVGRCGDGIDRALPCQCNTACVRYDDCCQDYAAACQGKVKVKYNLTK